MQAVPSLLEANDSIFIVVDVQDRFLERLDKDVSEQVVERICWLVKVADWLDVPIVVTAEETGTVGPTNARVRGCIPETSEDLDKVVFDLASQAEILKRVNDIGRKTAVLAGLETDVCVLQSAFGLAGEGYRVAVVADACAAPQAGHEHGLARLRDAGIVLVSTKGLFFEWVRDLEVCHRFFRNSGIGVPEGLYIG